MRIDWVTILAQVLNFLILVWLMKRFLYKPILNAIDAREKRIAAELADAEKNKADARKESDEFMKKNEEFDGQRAALMNKAADGAKSEHDRLLDEARKSVAVLSSKWHETLRNEEHNLHQEIRQRTQKEVFAIARKVLTDLAGTSLEERVVDVFIRRMRELNTEEKELIASVIKASPGPVIVRTMQELTLEHLASAEGAVKEVFGADIKIRFETAQNLISGIELIANGQKVAWSISDHLSSLEKGVDELLKKVQP